MNFFKQIAGFLKPDDLSKKDNPNHVEGLFIDANKAAHSQTEASSTINQIHAADTETTLPAFENITGSLLNKTFTHSVNPALPSFQSSANGRIDANSNADNIRRRMALRDAFVPSQPVTSTSYFVGRTQQLKRLISAIEEERSHVVLYGKRGLGKTSLINIFAQIAQNSGYIVLLDAPGAHASFSSLFRSYLSQIPMRFSRSITLSSTTAESEGNFDSLLPSSDFGPRELSDVLSLLTNTRVIMFIDEYDRVTSDLFRNQLAELLKNLSDRGARVSMVILGVAHNLDQLLGYHPSIRRNVVGIPVTRMNNKEVSEILMLGARPSQLTYTDEAEKDIIFKTAGSPYYARLLALYSCRNAIEANETVVQLQHIKQACLQLSSEFSAEFHDLYAELMINDKDQVIKGVISAAAYTFASSDEHFTIEMLQNNYVHLFERPIKTDAMEKVVLSLSMGDGAFLKKLIRTSSIQYTFQNPDFAFYVILCDSV